jgi:tetratricopeptide (TPR) repeat protein
LIVASIKIDRQSNHDDMLNHPTTTRSTSNAVAILMLGLIFAASVARAATFVKLVATNYTGDLMFTNGQVDFIRPPAEAALAALHQHLDPGDSLFTHPYARAIVRLANGGEVLMRDLSLLAIQVKPNELDVPEIFLTEGEVLIRSGGKSRQYRIKTVFAQGMPKGTEFIVKVKAGRMELVMFDGSVELRNDAGSELVTNGCVAVVEANQKPRVIGRIESQKLVQWWLYYPAIVDSGELPLSQVERELLRGSLEAYQRGDLNLALRSHPGFTNDAAPASDAQKVYLAGLMIAAGAVDRAELLLDNVREPNVFAVAMRMMIGAVSNRNLAGSATNAVEITQPSTASEWLALSYVCQATNDLRGALRAANQATVISPGFGFAWARAAELEFSFGNTRQARAAIDRALMCSANNAPAHALQGFLHAAQNRLPAARLAFEQAIQLDPALANGWLGRGLVRIHTGEVQAGLQDLQIAALTEPGRSLVRSYAGKAFADQGDTVMAARELSRARELDPLDPTPWLYSALLNHQQNRVNAALSDLEYSLDLSTNRAVYRSRFLLDQDRAVRAANLAAIYGDAGFDEVAVNTAGRAVNYDYANFSSHLFLANSYSTILNYTPQVNLRYETPRVSEYLVASLLAPVGAGSLSPTVSQQEYSPLFERDRLGFTSSTEYLSRGAWTESAAQWGICGRTSYSLDVYHQVDPGQHSNNDLDLTSFSVRYKQQITASDSLFFQAIGSDAEFGDLAQYYDPRDPRRGANPWIRSQERQEPIAMAGYHHEWSPAQHTLLLAGYLSDQLTVDNPAQSLLVLRRNYPGGPVASVLPYFMEQAYQSDYGVFTAEAQQVYQGESLRMIMGGRFQTGTVDTWNRQLPPAAYENAAGGVLPRSLFSTAIQDYDTDVHRFSGYVYLLKSWLSALELTAGMAYDQLTYPANFRYAPILNTEETVSQVSPKAGLSFTPLKDTVFRVAYARSLGGAGIDQSFHLEPTQVAGFNQAWRSLIPESVAGANSAERFDTAGAALEQKFSTRTYLTLTGEWLKSALDRDVGVFERDGLMMPGYIHQSSTRESLRFDERTLSFSIHQLAGDEWTLGARYRLSWGQLDDRFTDISPTATTYGDFQSAQTQEATLHQVQCFVGFNHPNGLFAQAFALWNAQSNQGYQPELSGDSFWQINLYAGYRFPRRRAEVRFGMLNLFNQDYRLNPLNLTPELPRELTFATSLRFSF